MQEIEEEWDRICLINVKIEHMAGKAVIVIKVKNGYWTILITADKDRLKIQGNK